MNIKPFIAAAVIALTAACTEDPVVVDQPVEAPNVEVVTEEKQFETDSGVIRPRQLSEENPAHKPN